MNKPLIRDFDYSEKKIFHFALMSDLHLEALDHNRKLLDLDLQRAVDLDARIYLNGDIFDFILPGDRKRHAIGRNPYSEDDQLGEIMGDVIKFLMPYKDRIDMIGVGNHEVSVVKYHHVDPIKWLIMELQRERDKSLPSIHHGGYTGFIRHVYRHGENRGTRTYDIWYNHGTGGSSPVTKGMIDINRAVIGNAADLYWMGHKHTAIQDNSIKLRMVNKAGEIVVKKRKAVFTGGYKTDTLLGHDYMKHGYKVDYGEESHLSLQADGCAILTQEVIGGNYGIISRISD